MALPSGALTTVLLTLPLEYILARCGLTPWHEHKPPTQVVLRGSGVAPTGKSGAPDYEIRAG
jgi:hypothetical protein